MKLLVNKKILTLSIIFLIISPFTGRAQYDIYKNQKIQSSFWDKVFVGGNLGLQFGTSTIIDISPMAGYKFNDNFAAGLGITYLYYNDKTYTPNYTTTIYGGRIFGRYYLPSYDNLFLHSEIELLDYDLLLVDPYNNYYKQRITANNILIGGGYSLPIGDNSSIDLLVLYNLNENANSLYTNPIIRMGVSFGL